MLESTKATYELVPLLGIGPLRLGMTEAESRSCLGIAPDKYVAFDSSPATRYFDSDLRAFIGPDGRVDEVDAQSKGPFFVFFHGMDIFSTPAHDLMHYIISSAPAIQLTSKSPTKVYIVPDLELLFGGMDPYPEERNWLFEYVSLGRRGMHKGWIRDWTQDGYTASPYPAT